MLTNLAQMAGSSVMKKVLLNGLVVLVRPVTHVPLVSTQLWYHVGSKDESLKEKGKAHLIEHMLFKGTDRYSETDLAAIVKKHSGSCNAFTSYDYTAYVFDFPSQYWKTGLEITSNTMRNCRFDEQMLNSELKAVISELKMNRDNYFKAVWQAMMSAIFVDHPYHYPVIGFKQDLWNLKRDDLFDFYKKHYVPNNATLVVVGDVDPQEVFEEAEKLFGSIPKDPSYARHEYYRQQDIIAQSVVVYRDIQQPYGLFAFIFPGSKENKNFEIQVLATLLDGGKDGRLTKKIVDELQLATDFSVFPMFLEDATFFAFYVCAKDEQSLEKIRLVIQQEIQEIIQNGIPKIELDRAVRLVKSQLLSKLENNYSQASMIGESYLMLGDENLPFKVLNASLVNLEQDIKELLKNYTLSTLMHSGRVLPFTPEGKQEWERLKKISDQEDARILDGRARHTAIEELKHVHAVSTQASKKFAFPQAQKNVLSNGVKVFTYHSSNVPKVEIVISLNSSQYHEPEALPGLYGIVTKMFLEGTKKYPGSLFAKELQQRGINLTVGIGTITMSLLKEDFEKGLELLQELLCHAEFNSEAIEKIRAISGAELTMYWDNPHAHAWKLAYDHLYENHPMRKDGVATVESLQSFSRTDLIDFYHTYFSGYKARIAVVGDVSGYEVTQLLEKYLGSWRVVPYDAITMPELPTLSEKTLTHTMARDEVIVLFLGRSITRSDADFDKLQLFDQIMSGGQSSRLFNLREQTGLFYSISGSLVAGSCEYPGLVKIFTSVSPAKLSEAKTLIQNSLKTMINSITQEELDLAKQIVISRAVNFFSVNPVMANTFLFLDKYGFQPTYFDTRAQTLNNITLEQVKAAACKVLDVAKMITVQVGPVQASSVTK